MMVVKLPNSISFKNRILNLIKEPRKVTYKHIKTDTKKMDSITFQNFQKLFIENDMTWRNKNEFIYTVRTPTRRNRTEQITKNSNQNAYLDKVNRENTFWLLQGGKVYRSINWVYCYYTSFDHSVNLDNKIYCFEKIRGRGFKQEICKGRKIVYTTSKYFRTLTLDEKKVMALVAKGNRLTIRAVPGTRFFVPEKIYDKTRQNFLKNTTFVANYDVSLILGFDFDEKSIYEFRLKNETVNMTIWDFPLPFFRIKGRGLNFDKFKFFCKGTLSQDKNLIEPPKKRAGYIV